MTAADHEWHLVASIALQISMSKGRDCADLKWKITELYGTKSVDVLCVVCYFGVFSVADLSIS